MIDNEQLKISSKILGDDELVYDIPLSQATFEPVSYKTDIFYLLAPIYKLPIY